MGRVPVQLILSALAMALAGAIPCRAEDVGTRDRSADRYAASICARSARSEDVLPTQAAWTTALARMTFQAPDYAQLQAFVQSDPEMVYATLRDGWPRIENVTVRQFLLQLLVNGVGMQMVNGKLGDRYAPNPHLLDILALGLNDPTVQIRNVASQALGGIAFREIRSLEDLREWRKEGGVGPIAQLMERSCRASLAQLESPKLEERANAYRRLLQIPFHSGRYTASSHGVTTHGLSVSGLVSLRRTAARDAGLIEIAARGLKPENPALLREMALRLIAHFGPDDATLATLATAIQREAPAVLDRVDAFETYDMLAQLKTRWVTDLLIQRIAEVDASRAFMSWTAASALGNTGDPRGIPSLIALYDAAQPGEYLSQVLERSLALLTGVPYAFNSGHDGDWWREWWQEHKQAFPAEARDQPFPQIAGIIRPLGFSLGRHSERRTLGSGVKRDYCLISPGIVAIPSQAVAPGLVVVLSDTPYSPAQSKYWQETAGRAWNGRYLVALIVRPANGKQPGSPELSIQDLAAEAVRDAQGRTTIDPHRVYMLGEGAAGLDVYACSLEKVTPFQGFLLVSSPFRSSRLPPLASAKGRRYYLLHDKADRAAPYVLTQAAQSLLKRQGAAVHLELLESKAADQTPALHQAMEWLERGRP